MQQKGPLNIAILGAGLIGVYGGAFAQRAGAKVTYVGRPRIQEQVKRHGILISTFQPSPDVPSEEFHLPPEDVKFVTELPSRAESAFDYIVVCLKCGATEDGAKAIVTGGHADPSLPAEERAKVVTFQNGARNPSILRDNLPPGTIVLAGSWPFNVAPGQRPGEFHQGVLGALKLENSPHAEPLQQILVKGGLPTDLFDDMEAHLYGKLLTNANNAVNALSGLTLKQQLSQRDYRLVVVETQKEGLEVLNKAGIKYLGLPAGGLEGW